MLNINNLISLYARTIGSADATAKKTTRAMQKIRQLTCCIPTFVSARCKESKIVIISQGTQPTVFLGFYTCSKL